MQRAECTHYPDTAPSTSGILKCLPTSSCYSSLLHFVLGGQVVESGFLRGRDDLRQKAADYAPRQPFLMREGRGFLCIVGLVRLQRLQNKLVAPLPSSADAIEQRGGSSLLRIGKRSLCKVHLGQRLHVHHYLSSSASANSGAPSERDAIAYRKRRRWGAGRHPFPAVYSCHDRDGDACVELARAKARIECCCPHELMTLIILSSDCMTGQVSEVV